MCELKRLRASVRLSTEAQSLACAYGRLPGAVARINALKRLQLRSLRHNQLIQRIYNTIRHAIISYIIILKQWGIVEKYYNLFWSYSSVSVCEVASIGVQNKCVSHINCGGGVIFFVYFILCVWINDNFKRFVFFPRYVPTTCLQLSQKIKKKYYEELS